MRWPTWLAITWSMETPAWMSVALFFRRTPVRNVPLPRAWSPAPSGPAVGRLVVEAAEDLDQVLSGSSGCERAAELEVGPLAARPPGGGDGAVGEVDERRAQRRAVAVVARPRGAVGRGEQPGAAQRRERRQGDRRRRGRAGSGGG